jgi:transcriptional/translational regulatory protein YebC/TACO1
VDDSRVVAALQKAKHNGLPKANIDRVLSARPGDDRSETCFVEAMGPGKAALLIECLTDSRSRTKIELLKIMSKNGCVGGARRQGAWAP